MSTPKAVRTFVTVIMDILVVLAIALTVRMVVEFFGSVAAQDWAKTIVALTEPLLLIEVAEPIATPYGGVFDVNAAIMIVVLVLLEWLLSVVRSR